MLSSSNYFSNSQTDRGHTIMIIHFGILIKNSLFGLNHSKNLSFNLLHFEIKTQLFLQFWACFGNLLVWKADLKKLNSMKKHFSHILVWILGPFLFPASGFGYSIQPLPGIRPYFPVYYYYLDVSLYFMKIV